MRVGRSISAVFVYIALVVVTQTRNGGGANIPGDFLLDLSPYGNVFRMGSGLGRSPLAASDEDFTPDCIPPGIEAFPSDFMTQDQRRMGGVVVHLIIVFYTCAMTAVVCDRYFVPALEAIASRLNLSPDVAGATFMAMGASAPELFSSVAGSFITEDDIGLGTIIGSAVLNILGISGIVGLTVWDQALTIRRYPVIRDCIVYGLTVLMLGYIIWDNVVTWWEALILLMIFASYIVLMHFNAAVERSVGEVGKMFRLKRKRKTPDPEKAPLLRNPKDLPDAAVPPVSAEKTADPILGPTTKFIDGEEHNAGKTPMASGDEADPPCACTPVWHLLLWPASLLFRLTIPPVRFYPATFLASIVWMGALSYLTVWMVTIIGYTFSIPDAVAGLTLLAAGSSVPDLIATVLIARSGQGNMAVSNLLGSNTFDLAFCLGGPWFLKTLTSGRGRLLVYSSAMVYTTATLLLTLVALLLIFQITDWKLNRTSGFACIGLYALCITLACLYELNVFGEINMPTCF